MNLKMEYITIGNENNYLFGSIPSFLEHMYILKDVRKRKRPLSLLKKNKRINKQKHSLMNNNNRV